MQKPTMLTIRQTSKETGLSYRLISDLVKEDKIVYIKVGNRTLVNLDRLIEYLQNGDGSRGC